MKFKTIFALSGLCVALAGCMTPSAPVQVTRFHEAGAGQSIAPGSVTIFAQDPDLQDSLEHRTYAAAVMRELQRLSFTSAGINSETPSQYSAYITVTRDVLAAGQRRSPVSVGVGGSTGSYGSGVGLGVGINLGGKPKDVVATELFVRINDSASSDAVWEGRAFVEAKDGSPAAQPGLAAAKLAEALFADFPGQSGETIRVP